MALLDTFLQKIQVMKGMGLKYRQPGDGSDGTCDCIGLIIGALRRSGIKWTGIHGSNYSARREMVSLNKIPSADALQLGDIVYKAYAPGNSNNTLPARYKPGGVYHNGDLNDYYHVGVVTSVNPLNITHMTSPTVKTDKKLGTWSYYGKLKKLQEGGGSVTPTPSPNPEPTPTPSSGKKAKVVAPSGKYVKMRQQPSQKCSLYDEIPIGSIVTLEEPGESWAKISYGKRKNWYMMAKFLEVL